MRWVRLRIFVVCTVLLTAGGIGGFRLLTADRHDGEPIVVGTTDTVTSLDPAGGYDAGSWAVFANIYQSLMTFTPGSDDPVPDAARSCRFTNNDLRVYVCELRPGLEFANGSQVTAQDVKFSFDRIRLIDSPQGPKPLLDTLEAVRAAGDTVTFELSSADATFPFKIATGAGAIVDRDQYAADSLRDDGGADGSGPYRLKSYEAGDRAELVPNPRYKGALEHLGEPVTIRYFEKPERLAAAWRKHTVDVAGRQMPPADLVALTEATDRGDTKIVQSTGAAIRSMVFDLREDSPMSEPAVRQAIAAVVDRPALARDVYDRTVDPLYSLIPKGVMGHTTSFFDLHPHPDAEHARELLAAAGIETPVRFSLAHSQGSVTGAEAATLRDQLERTGLFEVETRRYEWTEFQKGYASGDYDAYCVGWVADFPDPETFTAPVVGADSAYHNAYHEPRIEKLIRATQRNPHRQRVAEDFQDIQRIVAEDVPLLPLWQRKDFVLSAENITGTQYLSDGNGIWRLWELDRI